MCLSGLENYPRLQRKIIPTLLHGQNYLKENCLIVICFLKVKLIKNARINIKLFLEASRITYVHKGLYFYRIKGRTIIQTVTEKLLEDVLDTLEDRLCFVTMKGLYSDIYKNALLELLKFRSYRAYTGSL